MLPDQTRTDRTSVTVFDREHAEQSVTVRPHLFITDRMVIAISDDRDDETGDSMAAALNRTDVERVRDALSGWLTAWQPARPEIVVLCGSTRFCEAFRAANLRLTLAGHIVLSIGCDTRADGDLAVAGELGDDLSAIKARLDELHKRKIDLADRVVVLNVGGYIGQSTRSEIEYAERVGRPIEYLEPVQSAPVAAVTR